jgi:diguanylate cyclase (GGDEF)-like protein
MLEASPLRNDLRLEQLRALAIVDSPPEQEYDDLASLAAAVCHSPIAALNFVDAERHYTKAIVGMPEAQGRSVANETSFCAETVNSPAGVLVLPDTRTDERFREDPLVEGNPQVGFYAGVAITNRGQRVGVLCTFGPEPRAITRAEQTALATLARQAEAHLELRRRNSELRELAITDPLTGLANRTLLFDRLELALAEQKRSGGEVGVLTCDVDDFKPVNDRHGHQIGDRVLCDIAADLRTAVRALDTVARIAGDEFIVVCPNITGTQLEQIVERITHHNRPLLPDGSPAPNLSVGAITAAPDDTAASVLRRGDLAMYAAKPAPGVRHASASLATPPAGSRRGSRGR